MTIIEDVRVNAQTFPGVVLTVGNFDGLHLGHLAIIEKVVEQAKAEHGTAAVMTMRPHPREFFAPHHAPNLLTSEKTKLKLLEQAGVDVVYILPFNADTAALPPEEFVEGIIEERCAAKSIIVGHDCRFGKDARGDFEMLRVYGERDGFSVEEVPPVYKEGERVNSTLIRERVLAGELDEVELLLGRKYSITGVVVKGRGMGSKIGFPTANIRPDHRATPAQGVYVAEALVGDVRRPAAVNIGIAPTIRQEDITIEAHLLEFNEDIVGCEIEVVFHKRIRTEKKFPSIDDLIAQIRADVAATRAYFEENTGEQ